MHIANAISWIGVGRGMALVIAAGGACGLAVAGPEGATVARGAVDISSAGSATTITASHNAIINYSSFDIARGESVRFVQPSAESRVLNRIHSPSPTRIDGSISANGRVYLVNPSGVLFGRSAVVNVGAMYAAAASLSDAAFLNGVDRFTDARGDVVNAGRIEASSDVVLVGGSVANHGTISTPLGAVVYAAGDEVVIGDAFGTYAVTTTGTGPGTLLAGGSLSGGMLAGDAVSLAAWHTGSTDAANVTVAARGDVVIEGSVRSGGRVDVGGRRVVLAGDELSASGVGIDIRAADQLIVGGALPDAPRVTYAAGASAAATPMPITGGLDVTSVEAMASADTIEIVGGSATGATPPAGTITFFEETLEGGSGDVMLVAQSRVFVSGEFVNNAAGDGGRLLTLRDGRNLTVMTQNSVASGDTFDGINLGPSEGFAGVRLIGGGAFTASTGVAMDGGPADLRLAGVRADGGGISAGASGDLVLAGVLSAPGGDVTLGGGRVMTTDTVVESGGNIEVNGPVFARGSLAALGTGGAGSSVVFSSTIDAATFDGSTAINGPGVSVTAPGAAVSIAGTVGTDRRLGTLALEGASVSLNGALTQGSQNYTGSVTLGSGLYNVDGLQPSTPTDLALGGSIAFNGDVVLAGDVAVTTTAVSPEGAEPFSLLFTGTINADGTPRALVVDAVDESVTFAGTVGGVSPLASIAVGAGVATVSSVITTGGQEYTTATLAVGGPVLASSASGTIVIDGDVVLLGDTSIATSASSGSDITLTGDVDGGFALLLSALNGDVRIDGLVGGSTPVRSVAVGGSALSIAGVTSRGAQEYVASTQTTINDGTLFVMEGGPISFSGSVGTTGAATLSTPGDVTFAGGLSSGAFNVSGANVTVSGTSSVSSLAVNASGAFRATGGLSLMSSSISGIDVDAASITVLGDIALNAGGASFTTDAFSTTGTIIGGGLAFTPFTPGTDIVVAGGAAGDGLRITADLLSRLSVSTLTLGSLGGSESVRLVDAIDLGTTSLVSNLETIFGVADGSGVPSVRSSGTLTWNGSVSVASDVPPGLLRFEGSSVVFGSDVTAPSLLVNASTTSIGGDVTVANGMVFTGDVAITADGTTTLNGGTSRSVFGGSVFAADGVLSDLVVLTDPGFDTGASLGDEASIFFAGDIGVNPGAPSLGRFRSVLLGPSVAAPGGGSAAFAKVVFATSTAPGIPRTGGQTFSINATERVAVGDGASLLADGNLVINAGGADVAGVVRVSDLSVLGDLTINAVGPGGSMGTLEHVSRERFVTHTPESYTESLGGAFTPPLLDFGPDILAVGTLAVNAVVTQVVPDGASAGAVRPFIGDGMSLATGEFLASDGVLLPIDGTEPRVIQSARPGAGSSLAQALPIQISPLARGFAAPLGAEEDDPETLFASLDSVLLAELGIAASAPPRRSRPFDVVAVRDAGGGLGGFIDARDTDSGSIAAVADAYAAVFGATPADRRATAAAIRTVFAATKSDADDRNAALSEAIAEIDSVMVASLVDLVMLIEGSDLDDAQKRRIHLRLLAGVTPDGLDASVLLDALRPHGENTPETPAPSGAQAAAPDHARRVAMAD